MNKQIVNKLIEYIDAKFREHNAEDSSDRGLMETVWAREIKEEIEKMLEE